jgi:iron complex outermembrane recepter protein
MPGCPKNAAAFCRITIFILCLFVPVGLVAAQSAAIKRFDLPADLAERSLKRLSQQSGVEILFATEMTAAVRTAAVKGEFSVLEAANRALAHTGLVAVQDLKSDVVIINRITPPQKKEATPQEPPGDPDHSSSAKKKAPAAPSNKPMKRSNLLTRLTASLAGLATPLVAQVAPPANSMPETQEVVELSPFVVNTTSDVGYVAENTLAGSRLNTRLRDTAGSVSVFTKEFLDDTAITDLPRLLQYSVNSEIETNESKPAAGQNPYINAERFNSAILIRGLMASQGLDYFTSITPTDPYRVSRYEDSRGPNSILFGIGAPGGLLNQSSIAAVTHSDSTSIRYGFGSWDRSRLELNSNKVLRKDELAVSIAAVHQENGGWRQFDFQDKDRIFGSVTFRPLRSLTFTAMGETGREVSAVVITSSAFEQVLAWYDNRNAFGVDAVTFTPNNTLPNASQQAVGVVGRTVARTGNNRRVIFIENDGTVYDASGVFLTGSYNNAAVRHPDGTPGTTGSGLRLNDPAFYPYFNNAAGPGMYRDQTLSNYTLSLDWQPTRNFVLNLGHNFQKTLVKVYLMKNQEPAMAGDPNRTQGVGGPPNPYAGRLYFDGNWQRDTNKGKYRETRLSMSYSLDTKSRWLGSHRLAGLVSRTDQFANRANAYLVLAGRPFNNVPDNVNNRITVRNYITEGDYGTYRVGDWRNLPSTVQLDGKSYDLVFANELAGASNSGGMQTSDSGLAVVQSHLLNGKLVTTFGYRRDEVEITELGYTTHPIFGDIVDTNRANGKVTKAEGRTHTAGVVYHVRDWLSLIANRSTNVGLPSFVRTVFPDGDLAPPSRGKGEDYGIGLDLLDGRVSSRLVYFKSTEKGRIDTPGLSGNPARNRRVMDAFAGVLVGQGRRFSESEWASIYGAYTPAVSSASSDFDSDGYEARVTANLTRNWRLVANYSYTDSGRINLASEMVAWYGLKAGDQTPLIQGVSQDATGRFIVDPSAYEAGKTVAKWIELGGMDPAANPSTLTTDTGLTVAQELFNLVSTLNSDKEQQEKRWGVRPHKISLFTAYDFKEGFAKGFTIGGGWRWRSANVIGTDVNGREINGREITGTDLMLGYTRKLRGLPGQVRFQVNVMNVFNQTDIIPSRLSTSAAAPNGFMVPGNRGMAYSRYELVEPRQVQFTTTYSF